MVIEMWPVVGYLLALLTCTPAQSQLTVLSPDSVEPYTNRSIIFYQHGQNGYYGNNVTLRTTYLQDSANKAWYDEEVILPNGTLRKFYLMAHNYGQLDEASRRIRLQIWRPVDMNNMRLMLVWQQRVQVAASAQVAMLYTYSINQTVALVAGDRIGWAFEGKAGPISFQYKESHRTRLQKQDLWYAFLPQIGQTIDFDYTYLPSIFSVAVSVDYTLPGYPGSSVPPGSIETTGATKTAGATGYTRPSVPPGSTGTTGATKAAGTACALGIGLGIGLGVPLLVFIILTVFFAVKSKRLETPLEQKSRNDRTELGEVQEPPVGQLNESVNHHYQQLNRNLVISSGAMYDKLRA